MSQVFKLLLVLVYGCSVLLVSGQQAPSPYCQARPVRCTLADVWPMRDDCTRYYRCNGAGKWKTRSCNRQRVFDVTSLTCTNRNRATCLNCEYAEPADPACDRPSPCKSNDRLPDPNNCHRYYVCDYNRWLVQDCAPGTKYDKARKLCDHVTNTAIVCQLPCANMTTVTPELISSTTTLSSTASSLTAVLSTLQSTTTLSTTTTTTTTTTTPAAQESRPECSISNDSPCSAGSAKVLPRPGDCHLFYACIGRQWRQGNCLELRFDSVTNKCTSGNVTCSPPCPGASEGPSEITTTIATTASTTKAAAPPNNGATCRDVTLTMPLEELCNSPMRTDHSSCKFDGVVLIHTHPEDCRRYFVCAGANYWQTGACAPLHRFDPATCSCQPHSRVPECPLRCQGNSTTIDAIPSTTSATSPTTLTTTPIPTTTTATTTTTTNPTTSTTTTDTTTPISTTAVSTTTSASTTSTTTSPTTTSTTSVSTSTSSISTPSKSSETTTSPTSTSTTTSPPSTTTILSTTSSYPTSTTTSMTTSTTTSEASTTSTARKVSLTSQTATVIESTSKGLSPSPTTSTASTTSTIASTSSTPTAETSPASTIMPSTARITTTTTATTTEMLRSCLPEVASGLGWPETPIGRTYHLDCPGGRKGKVSRACHKDAGMGARWSVPDFQFCVDKPFQVLVEKVDTLAGAPTFQPVTSRDLMRTTARLARLTDISTTPLRPGNLNASVLVLDVLSQLTEAANGSDAVQLSTMTGVASNLLSPRNDRGWSALQKRDPSRSVTLMGSVDRIGQTAAAAMPPGQRTISSENLDIRIDVMPKEDATKFEFTPGNQRGASSGDSMRDQVVLEKATVDALGEMIPGENVAIWSTYFRTLHELLPVEQDEIINSKILSVSVQSLPDGARLSPPIRLHFTSFNTSATKYDSECSFWEFAEEDMNGGRWSDEGCETVFSNSTGTVCACKHLTNFAVLLSPHHATGVHASILRIISVVGCLISILGMLATICLYVLSWKRIKSHHAAVLINLCIALILANVTFLAGIDRTETKVICTVVAALLHYFFLAAFFIMFAEGVQFILYVVQVFHVRRKRETLLLLLTSWILPGVIVGITLSITRGEGYGTEDYCWIRKETGLIAAFAVPALIVIIANFIILCKILHTIAHSKGSEKTNRVKATVWNIAVMMPLLGMTWIFGFFSVGESTIAFQYIFAVCNSLQGFFIFFFHCVLNKKMRQAVAERFSSRYSQSSSLRKSEERKRQTTRKKIDAEGGHRSPEPKSPRLSDPFQPAARRSQNYGTPTDDRPYRTAEYLRSDELYRAHQQLQLLDEPYADQKAVPLPTKQSKSERKRSKPTKIKPIKPSKTV